MKRMLIIFGILSFSMSAALAGSTEIVKSSKKFFNKNFGQDHTQVDVKARRRYVQLPEQLHSIRKTTKDLQFDNEKLHQHVQNISNTAKKALATHGEFLTQAKANVKHSTGRDRPFNDLRTWVGSPPKMKVPQLSLGKAPPPTAEQLRAQKIKEDFNRRTGKLNQRISDLDNVDKSTLNDADTVKLRELQKTLRMHSNFTEEKTPDN